MLSDPYAADLGWLASTPTGYVVASVILGAFWMLLLALGGSRATAAWWAAASRSTSTSR